MAPNSTRKMRYCKYWLVVSAVLTGACMRPDTATAPMGDPSTFFATLEVREHAVTLALGPTPSSVQLHVAARYADESPVTAKIIFTESDSTIAVDSTGIVTARFPTTNPAVVRIAVTDGGLTRRDSVLIRVLASPSTVQLSRIDLIPLDSVVPTIPMSFAPTDFNESVQGGLQLNARALSSQGELVPSADILIAFRSSDRKTAVVDPMGYVTALRPGHVVITATSVASGVFATDSIVVTIGFPQYAGFRVFSPDNVSEPSSVWRLGGDTARISAGGVIEWSNTATTQVDIIFDDPTNVRAAASPPFLVANGQGNIRNLGLGTVDPNDFLAVFRATGVARSFPYPGIYRFRGVVHGTSESNGFHGVVIVCPISDVLCNS